MGRKELSTTWSDKAQKKIVGNLRTLIPSLTITPGIGISTDALLQLFELIDLDNQLPPAIREHLGDFPLTSFVANELRRKIRELEFQQEAVSLTSFEQFADVEALANELFQGLTQLPNQYVLSTPLPQQISDLVAPRALPVALSKHIHLLPKSHERISEYSLDAGSDLANRRMHGSYSNLMNALAPPNPNWPIDQAVFRVQTEGYLGSFGRNVLLGTQTEILKTFLGLCIAQNLLKFDRNASKKVSKISVYAHRRFGEDWIIDERLELEDALATSIGQLTPRLKDVSSDKAKEYASNALLGASIVIRSSEKGRTLATAARWLFESHAGHDEVMNYVKAMIVLESILRDQKPNDASLTSLIGTRLAFAIGESPSERASIEKDFASLYKIRGKIIHRGYHRLTLEEQSALGQLHDFCSQIMAHEIKLLSNELKSKPEP